MNQPIAIVMSEVFLRRLTPALIPFVRRQRDYRVVSIHRPLSELRAVLSDLRPSGLITEWLPDTTEALLELGLPTVIADTDRIYPGAISVDVDDWAVGAEAARAFVQAGYRHCAVLSNGTPYAVQRVEGFWRELGPECVVSVHTETDFEEAGYSEHFKEPSAALREWLRALPKPVGIFAVHDPLGRFLCAACQQVDLKVPEEVAVIGANNDALVCGLSYPMLSSVRIPWEGIGEVVGKSMQALLSGNTGGGPPRLLRPGGVEMRHSANYLAVDDPVLRRAMSLMEERLREPLTVEALCIRLRVARRSLERKFREYYRCSPWEMLCRLRVNRAKSLLTQSNHPVSLIAELCGFNDPERMTVVFKRETGMPPSGFRKMRNR